MNKIFSLCEKHAFLKKVPYGSHPEQILFGPCGEFLINNIRQEWMYSNVTGREENIFPFHGVALNRSLQLSDIKEPFLFAKSLCNGQLPFGLAHIQPQHSSVDDGEESVFTFKHKTVLRSLLFVSPIDAMQRFYTWQQSRKMWWRKFSAYPGRFTLSDIKETSMDGSIENGLNDQRVNIVANFDWDEATVESIRLYPITSVELLSESLEDFKARDGRKLVAPCIVESVTSLEEASLIFLCDAYNETKAPRCLLRLHRRLAPFKTGFVAAPKEVSVADKLRDLAQHLSSQLRSGGLMTLLPPDMARKSLESQLARNDEMGIPFSVVLTDSTLSDGIVRLYSRETTLKEQVHISQLSKYLSLLMKNY